MEKYLISLLDLNKRIIIPDLGAFIVRQNENKELVFNDLLSFNDGMLTDYIIQSDKLSKSEAQNRIKQFVDKVIQTLNEGKAFKLDKLGTLNMNDSNRIEFSMSDSTPDIEKSVAKETLSENAEELVEKETTVEKPDTDTAIDSQKEEPSVPAEDETTTPPADEISDTVSSGDEEGFVLTDDDADVDIDATQEVTPLKPDSEEPPFQIDDENEPEKETIVAEVPEKPEKPEEPEKTVVAEVPEEPEEPVVKEPEKTPEYKVVSSETDSSPFSAYSQTRQSKKKAWPWIVSTIALIVLLLAAGWFLFPEKADKLLGKKISESIDQFPVPADEETYDKTEDIIAEPVSTQEEQQVEVTEIKDPTPATQPASKKYYVVAGCFAELKNAQNYMHRLQDQGHSASVFGKHKNLHAVCFNSHADKQHAVEELYRIRNSFDSNAWILYY